MSSGYRDPTLRVMRSNASRVYCMSDIHMGNARPTNDLTGRSYIHFRNVLLKLKGTINTGETNKFDLVFNGDVFDFWKAIPEPLPNENDLKLGDLKKDYNLRRFQEILQYNHDIIKILAGMIFDPRYEKGMHLIILPGNHDDVFPQYEREFRKKLIEHFIVAAYLEGIITNLNQQATYVYELNKRLHTRYVVYWNKKLKLYIEHGHRFDDHNRLRTIDSRNIESEGQIIVEGLLNGLHDINLNQNQHLWRFYLRRNSKLRKALRLIDNFYDPLDGIQLIKKIANDSNMSQAYDLLRWDMVHNFRHAEMELIDLADFVLGSYNWVQVAADVFRRNVWDRKPTPKENAREIMNYNDSWARRSTGGIKPKIVIFGHTHINESDPPLDKKNVPRQYVNTGTFVESYETSNPPFRTVLPQWVKIEARPLNYAKPPRANVSNPQNISNDVQIW